MYEIPPGRPVGPRMRRRFPMPLGYGHHDSDTRPLIGEVVGAVQALAQVIGEVVPPGTQKAKALLDLEGVLMRSMRAFDVPEPRLYGDDGPKYPGRGSCGHVEVEPHCVPCAARADAPDEEFGILGDPCPNHCGHRWGQHHEGGKCFVDDCPCTAGWRTQAEWKAHADTTR